MARPPDEVRRRGKPSHLCRTHTDLVGVAQRRDEVRAVVDAGVGLLGRGGGEGGAHGAGRGEQRKRDGGDAKKRGSAHDLLRFRRPPGLAA